MAHSCHGFCPATNPVTRDGPVIFYKGARITDVYIFTSQIKSSGKKKEKKEEREREEKRNEREIYARTKSPCFYIYMYIYIKYTYTYVYIYISSTRILWRSNVRSFIEEISLILSS